MFGAILGDMVGAPYEFDRGKKTKEFEFWNPRCQFTDDSVMTIAIADALIYAGTEATENEIKKAVIEAMQDWGHRYPNAGYGGRFRGWLKEKNFEVILESIYYRMHEDGRWLVPVIPQQSLENLIDLKSVKVGDTVTIEEEQRFKYQHLETDDGRSWIVAFTSDEEFHKGPSSDLFTMVIRDILESFSDKDCPEDGIIINPWGEKFLLTKEFMEAILELEEPKNSIEFFVGDITELPVDAIVNAANKSLLGGGGVDGAIHRAAGKELLEECRKFHGCKTGEAVITKGYKLPAQHVIHTVGPIYSGAKEDADRLFECYYNSLELAARYHLHSIAFPGISTGVYGYPKDEAAEVALTAILNWFNENEKYGMRVIIVNFSKEDWQVYQDVWNKAKEGK